jgi:membrane-associated phospholipid phosphatase
MDRTTQQYEIEAPSTPATERDRRHHNTPIHYIRYIIEVVLWSIGLIVLLVSSLYIHMNPGPLPGELTFSRAVQGLHLWPPVIGFLVFVSAFNDVPETIAALVLWFVALCIFRKFKQAIFFALTIGVGDGINALIGLYVSRPRPSPKLLHVDSHLVVSSFPSGHTEHDIVYYGYLLFLSFTRPVREWRYHWVLLPFQIFAIVAILTIGFSRIYEGEHWLTDVLGGYLSGVLWLTLFIFLYRWTTDKLAERRRRKTEQQAGV